MANIVITAKTIISVDKVLPSLTIFMIPLNCAFHHNVTATSEVPAQTTANDKSKRFFIICMSKATIITPSVNSLHYVPRAESISFFILLCNFFDKIVNKGKITFKSKNHSQK